MKIFISWSGKLSQEVGLILRGYLTAMFSDVEVFMSSQDIEYGKRWIAELSKNLEESNYGIVCLSPGYTDKPWLLFEAGAISKLGEAAVCGLLLSFLKPTDISGPLSQFQNMRFTNVDMLNLILSINKHSKFPKTEENLKQLFNMTWSDLNGKYDALIDAVQSQSEPTRGRTEQEYLEEILSKVRSLEMQVARNASTLKEEDMDSILLELITSDSITTYAKYKFPKLMVSESWLEQLLADINSSKYRYVRDIDDVLTKAEKALDAYATENPRSFRYSTDYLTKALGFVDKDFSEIHPWSISSREAFDKYEHLIE